MSRKFADDIELPNRDPSTGNYAARKTYVDAAASNASGLTTGTVPNARLPKVMSPVATGTVSAGVVALDASALAGNNVDISTGTSYTQNVPTNGTAGQVLNVTVWATAAITITFNASFIRLGTIAATLAPAISKFARYQLRCTNASGTLTWIVEAAAVGQ
jgi:hypothetical protein